MSKRLIGRALCHNEVSKSARELTSAVEAWRERDLSKEQIKYIVVDGVNFLMRVDGSIERVPVLVAIRIREDGSRTVLGLQAGDKKALEFFEQFKARWEKEIPSAVRCLGRV